MTKKTKKKLSFIKINKTKFKNKQTLKFDNFTENDFDSMKKTFLQPYDGTKEIFELLGETTKEIPDLFFLNLFLDTSLSINYWINGQDIPDDAKEIRNEGHVVVDKINDLPEVTYKINNFIKDTGEIVKQNAEILNENSFLIAQNKAELNKNNRQINLNFENIKKYEDKANERQKIVKTKFENLEKKVLKVINKLVETKLVLKKQVDLMKQNIIDVLLKEQINNVVDNMMSVFGHFTRISQEIYKSNIEKRLYMLEDDENSILLYIANARIPKEKTLHTSLMNIINLGYYLPKNSKDLTAMTMFSMLIYGVQMYLTMFNFATQQYNWLQSYYIQKSNIDSYNKYYLENLNTIEDFKSSFLGNCGIVVKVINAIKTIKSLDLMTINSKNIANNVDPLFVQNFEKVYKQTNTFLHFVLVFFSNVGSLIDPIVPPRLSPQLFFSKKSHVPVPILGWTAKTTLRYAMQYAGDSSSMVGDWSRPYTVDSSANPLVMGIPIDPTGSRARIIYRQLNNNKPEIVAILVGNATAFWDIDRDLFNALTDSNIDVALSNEKLYLSVGANANAIFDNAKQPIHLAVSKSLEMTKLLVHFNASLNFTDDKGHTALHIATEHNKPEIVKFLLENNQTNVNDKADKMYLNLTSLHSASYNGFIEIIKLFLNFPKTNVNIKGQNNLSPLHYAASFNQSKIVKKLIVNEKIIVDAQSTQKFTPLHFAAINNCPKVAEILLKLGKVNVNAEANNHLTPLHLASFFGSEKIVKILLQNNASAIAKTSDGSVPLHYVSYNGNVQILDLLIKKHKDSIDRQNDQELTPLYISYMYNRTTSIKHLSAFCANAKIQLMQNKTLLHLAAQQGEITAVEKLINEGLDANAYDYNHWKPIHYALINGKHDVIKFLLNENRTSVDSLVEFDKHSKYNKIPLLHLLPFLNEEDSIIIARYLIKKGISNVNDPYDEPVINKVAAKGHFYLTKYFIDVGASLNNSKNTGTALHAAASKKENVEILKLLLQNKVLIDALNENGETALHLAVRNDMLHNAKYLVKSGSNINAADKCYRTPLLIALAENGSFDMIQMLLEFGAELSQYDCLGNSIFHYIVKKPTIFKYIFNLHKNLRSLSINKNGQTSLMEAAKYNSFTACNYFFTTNVSKINYKNKLGQTALYWAVKGSGSLNIVKLFIENKASLILNIKRSDGSTVKLVDVAANRNKLDVVKFIIEQTDQGKEKDLTYALIEAVKHGSQKLVDYLLASNKTNVNVEDKVNKRNLLHMAAEANNTVITIFLSEKHYLKCKSDIEGNTPMHSVSKLNNVKLAKYLSESICKKNINKKNNNGTSPLEAAIQGNGTLEMIKLLFEKNANIQIPDLVYWAIVKNKNDVAKFLINNGADFKTPTNFKTTPLEAAIKKQNIETIKFLVFKGAKPNLIKTKQGKTLIEFAINNRYDRSVRFFVFDSVDEHSLRTSLHQAVNENNLNVVKFLINRGAYINAVDIFKSTPLHVAAQNGNLEIVKFLSKQKCIDFNAKNKNNQNAIELAEYTNHFDVAEFLKNQVKHLNKNNILINDFNKLNFNTNNLNNVDINSTLFLFDVFTRIKTGVKYNFKQNKAITDYETRALALEIVDYYDQFTIEFSLSLNVFPNSFDTFKIYQKIEKILKKEEFKFIENLLQNVSKTVFSNYLKNNLKFQQILQKSVQKFVQTIEKIKIKKVCKNC